jgi:hypothetical protein
MGENIFLNQNIFFLIPKILGQGVGKSRFLKSPSPNLGLQSESESDEMDGSEKLW